MGLISTGCKGRFGLSPAFFGAKNVLFRANFHFQEKVLNQVISGKVVSTLPGLRVNGMKSIRGEADEMQKAKILL